MFYYYWIGLVGCNILKYQTIVHILKGVTQAKKLILKV